MSKKIQKDLPLSGYRALDITDEKGFYCGKVLGDLGVDVVKIEPPSGDPARRLGPFSDDIPDPQKSLYWFAFNNSKRGITLDITTADGQQIFKRLAEKADFVIESFDPDYMDGLGLGYQDLSAIKADIIVTSITPFGQTGPYKDYKGSDLVLLSTGGFLYHVGDPDRPPVRFAPPQSYYNAGVEAAIGTLMAHTYRQASGQGQHVDVSIQASQELPFYVTRDFWELDRVIKKRQGCRYAIVSTLTTGPKIIYRCKDGYIAFGFYGGIQGERTNQALVEWMDEKGMAPQFLKEVNWNKLSLALINQKELDAMLDAFSAFFETLTRDEFYKGAVERRILGYPVSGIDDVLSSEQLASRQFWQEVEHPELGASITYPGAFAKFSETPIGIKCRAPLIGEHNDEVYRGELGFSKEELCLLKQGGVI